MSAFMTSTCSICGDTLGCAGDHQICCLACGHMFGFKCITKWFETCSTCPRCSKQIHYRDIRLLFWPTASQVLETEITRLEESNAIISREIESLELEKTQLHNKLTAGREQLALQRMTAIPERAQQQITSITHPSIIFEKNITGGMRLCATEDKLIVSCRSGERYGLEVMPLNSLTESLYIPNHGLRITDIIETNKSVIITTSCDRTIAETSIERCAVSYTHSFDVGLWCATPIFNNLIVLGGDRGSVIYIDVRSDTIVWRKDLNGPPIVSIARLKDNTVMAMSTQESVIYDVRKGDAVRNIYKDVGGGICIRGKRDTSIYSVLTRNETGCDSCFCSLSQANKFTTFMKIPTGSLSPMCRSAVTTINGTVYCAVPNNSSCGFSFRGMSQPHNDLFENWRTRWDRSQKTDPALDLSIIQQPQSIVIPCVTCDKLTVYEIPIPS